MANKKKAKKKVAKKKVAKRVVPKLDRPWWGNNDPLWGGETFKSQETASNIGVKSGDLFRVERTPAGVITLIPHPKNEGTWNETHSKTNPVVLTLVADPTPHERAFSMMVTKKSGTNPIEVFLVERTGSPQNPNIAGKPQIRKKLVPPPGQDGDTCSVER